MNFSPLNLLPRKVVGHTVCSHCMTVDVCFVKCLVSTEHGDMIFENFVSVSVCCDVGQGGSFKKP